MKYVIDEDVCAKHGLSINQVFGVLFCKTSEDILADIEDMQDKEILSKLVTSPYPTPHWDDEVCAILLESDKVVPSKDRCSALADKLRELFPKGIKTGSSAWRGNNREITLRLQKFFKLYGNKWSDEEIIEATRKYIESFNGNYTYMRILKYFIMKSVSKTDEEGVNHIEDVSELANWLENDTSNATSDDWLSEMR